MTVLVIYNCSRTKRPIYNCKENLWSAYKSRKIYPNFRLKNKKPLLLEPWGPVRGSFTSTGALRALVLAEVSLPLGTSPLGLLVLLISSHDSSASVQPDLLSFLFLSHSIFIFFIYFLLPAARFSVSLIALLSGPYLLLSFILYFSFLSCHLFLSVGSAVWLRVSYEGAAAGGGPPCLVITSLFITRPNGHRGEGNNNKLIEYELQLNRNLQRFILSCPVLWQMKRSSD